MAILRLNFFVLRRFVAFAIVLVSFVMSAECISQDAKDAKSGNYMLRQYQQKKWKVAAPDDDGQIKISAGDVIVAKDSPLTFKVGDSKLLLFPGTVMRIHIVEKEGEEPSLPIPEILFGEVLFEGDGATKVFHPGQNLELRGKAILTVDYERYSFVESVRGEQTVQPQGLEDVYPVEEGNYIEMSPFGEVGVPGPIDESFLEEYREIEPEGGEAAIVLEEKGEPQPLEPLDEYWNEDRVEMLREGEESPEGLAIAAGAHLEQEDSGEAVETVEAFDQAGVVKQKSLSFSSSVSVEQVASSIPELTSFSIGGKKVADGDFVNLAFENLEDGNLPVSGMASSSDPEGMWSIVIKLGDDEYTSNNIKSFSASIRVDQEFPELPNVYGIEIAMKPAEIFEGEYNLLSRDDLVSGRLEITGFALPGNNVLTYNIEVSAVSKDDESHVIGKFTAELDLSELDRVEVSADDGISWEQATGKQDWKYEMKPSDGEQYKIRARAIDVMGNQSEEQFESYQFKYSYQTPKELLRDTFDTMMRALLDEDRNTFLRNVSMEFSTDIEDLRDYNELEEALDTRFRTGSINIRYSVNDVLAYMDTLQGTVDFYWSGTSSLSSGSYYDAFNYFFEEGKWMLVEVLDPNTFLLPSKEAHFLEISLADNTLEADGEDSTRVSVMVYDEAGTIVADDVAVVFTATAGSFDPQTAYTSDGEAETSYIAPTNDGTVTITATSGSAQQSTTISIEPISPPLPPESE